MSKSLWKSTLCIATLFAAAIPSTGCIYWIDASQGSIFIESALRVKNGTDGCDTAVDDVIANGILDIGTARPYTAGLTVTTNLPSTLTSQDVNQDRQRSPNYPAYGAADNNIVSIRRAYVQMTDGDTDEPIAGLPRGRPEGILGIFLPGQERITPTGGVVYNTQTQLGTQQVVFFSAITQDEAAVLRNGPIGAQLGDPGQSKRILVNVFLEGQTTGASSVRSTSFSYPIDLCRGCLIPEVCPDGAVPQEAVDVDECALNGQDVSTFQCP